MLTRCLLVVCLASLAGCSSAPVNLQSNYADPPARHDNVVYTQGARAVAATAPLPRCNVFLESVQDLRTDKDDMGNIAGSPVRSANMLQWMETGLGTLSESGYRIDKAATDDAVIMDVELLKAYMISMSTSKSANMVVRVIYKHPDGSALATQIYRGVDISVDWAAGEGETNSAFQRSTKQILDKMGSDLGGYCHGTTVAMAR